MTRTGCYRSSDRPFYTKDSDSIKMATRAIYIYILPVVLFGTFNGSDRAQIRYLVMAGSCSACNTHNKLRELSLEAIREEILNKLGLKQAPNMTGRAIPKIPPISKLMDMYGEIQNDGPLESLESEDDNFSARTESLIALAAPRKFLSFYLISQTKQITYSI